MAGAWVPEEGGPWPALLQRLPYGRAVASTRYCPIRAGWPVRATPLWCRTFGVAVNPVVLLAAQERGSQPIIPNLDALPTACALGPSPPAWFREWLEHPDRDSYWEARSPDLGAIDVPAFLVLGFFDDFSAGTARLIEALDAEALCGPWAHMPWGTRAGDVELGAVASPAPVAPALVAFFDRVLKGIGEAPPHAVRYLAYGAERQSADDWPPAHETRLYLARSEGNANSRHGDGRLEPGPGVAAVPSVPVAEPLVAFPGGPHRPSKWTCSSWNCRWFPPDVGRRL